MPRHPALPRWGPPVALAVLWLAMKVLSVWAWVRLPGAWGDTWYYFQSAQRAFAGAGIEGVLREYPTPAAALLLVPYALGAHDIVSYREAVIWGTSAVDAAFTLLLGRLAGPLAVGGWITCTTLLGQLPLLRFDVLPVAVAGAVVLLLARGRPATASALAALGTGLKVWPILLAPLTLADARARLRPLLAFAATGFALVAVSLPFGGFDRLFSPLGYQRDRGLQIEAVPATLPMLGWAGGDASLGVHYGPYYAYELAGPAADRWITVSDAAGIVALVVCVALLAFWYAAGSPMGAMPYLALAFVTAFVVTSRALSPQYLLWLAAPVAVLLGLDAGRAGLDGLDGASQRGRPPGPAASALATFLALALLCLLTTGIYPVNYGGLTNRTDGTGRAVLLLVARNGGLLAFGCWVIANAWVITARARRYSGRAYSTT